MVCAENSHFSCIRRSAVDYVTIKLDWLTQPTNPHPTHPTHVDMG
jgi:hypothetical protein